jgi:hypothetical protein
MSHQASAAFQDLVGHAESLGDVARLLHDELESRVSGPEIGPLADRTRARVLHQLRRLAAEIDALDGAVEMGPVHGDDALKEALDEIRTGPLGAPPPLGS